MSVTKLSAGSSTKIISKRDNLKKDMRARKRFARKVINFLPEGFWKERVSFYFDALGSHTKQIHLEKLVQLVQ